MLIFMNGLFACNSNTINELANYKNNANVAIQDYIDTKVHAEYTAENWTVIYELVENGKVLVDAAKDRADVDNIIATIKIAIDEIPKEEITDFEHISDEELEYIFKNHDKYPINIGYINDKHYGRIVNSSSSVDNALEEVTNHFTDNRYSFSTCNVVEVTLDIETELFYGVYVKWEHNSFGDLSYYDEYVVSFKKEIYDCKVKKFITDTEISIFNTDDPAQIKQIMDYKYYSKTYQILGSKLLQSEVTETENLYIYKAYGITCIGGDWGLQDTIFLIRNIWEIDKSSGEMVLSSSDTLKTIYIDGKYTHSYFR